jgi:hypothetical protein
VSGSAKERAHRAAGKCGVGGDSTCRLQTIMGRNGRLALLKALGKKGSTWTSCSVI